MKQILYYTDNRLDDRLFKLCQDKLLESGLPIVSVSLEPIDFGDNIVFDGKRSYLTLFRQILAGLIYSKGGQIFMCEHDVLYHPSYFEYDIPHKEAFFYNLNAVKLKTSTGQVVGYDAKWLSQMTADRRTLIDHYEWRVKELMNGSKIRSEPGTRTVVKDKPARVWRSKYPNIDIRHGLNLTGVSRFEKNEFRNKYGRPNFKKYMLEDIEGWDIDLLRSLCY